MKSNKLYILIAILTSIFLFTTAAVCNQCVATPEEEISVEIEEETAEEKAEEEEDAKEDGDIEEKDELKEWETYINDVYGYEFNYPSEAEIIEADISSFGLSPEEVAQGLTFEDIYNEYTGKICVTIDYKLGYINISVPENKYVLCGRSGVGAYEVEEIEEEIIIEGQAYTAKGIEVKGPGETLAYHNEFLRIALEDGTKIEYGSRYDEEALYDDYLKIKDELIKIVESYRKI